MKFANFLDIPVAIVDAESAPTEILMATQGEPRAFRFINAGSLSAARRDSAYWGLLRGDGVNFPDGAPLAAALRCSGSSEVKQTRGPAVFERTIELGLAAETRHYFLGSDEQTLRELQERLRANYPEIRVVGASSPPFRRQTPDEIERQDNKLAASGADIVWVALGTPKQDVEAERIWRKIGITTAAVGAAFDFSAGTKPEAPVWIRRIGCEWLFRLASEPQRLWRRYLLGNFDFLILCCRHFVEGNLAYRRRS